MSGRCLLLCASLSVLVSLATSHGVNGQSLYWTEYGSDRICRGNIDGTGQTVLVSGLGHIIGLDIDPSAKKMYWLNRSTFKVQSANLDGSEVVDLVSMPQDTDPAKGPLSVCVDATNRQIYWTPGNIYPTGYSIYRSNSDGTGTVRLIGGLSIPDAMAVDPTAGYIYWGEHGTQRIARAELDGTGITTLANWQTSGGGTGIALDRQIQQVYWSQSNDHIIRQANLDGTNPTTLLSLGTERPFGLSLDPGDNEIFWDDFDGGRIRCADLDGTNVRTVFSGLSKPRSVIFVAASVPEPGSLLMLSVAATSLVTYAWRRRLNSSSR
jgi:DNA-binding beta-propeller fold protein YncE